MQESRPHVDKDLYISNKTRERERERGRGDWLFNYLNFKSAKWERVLLRALRHKDRDFITFYLIFLADSKDGAVV